MQQNNIDFNPDFQIAFNYITQTRQSVFLTGKAGTGKTTFLKHLKTTCKKNMVVCAPTGVAAINAGGVTIHSLFQLPFNAYIPEARGWGMQEVVVDKNDLVSKIKFRKDRLDILRNLELLVIDEISMVRADTLDAIDVLLRAVRHKATLPFGGVQLLMIGDLFQLPPVIKDMEWNILKDYYTSPFFFDSVVLKTAKPTCINFTKVYRQKEDSFKTLLNNVRENKVSDDDLQILNKRYAPQAQLDNVITLCTHNHQADTINNSRLSNLSTKAYIYKADVSGEFSEYAFPTDAQITLKVGAQVMFTKNDTGDDRQFFNGKIGKIHFLDNEKIIVNCDGIKIEVKQHAWKNIKYTVNKENNQVEEAELGAFKQFPLRLAWAITIHKSQGLTFEKCAIDGAKSFTGGQLYVALSRCTTLEGITLLSRIPAHALMVNSHVVQYMNKSEEENIEDLLADYKNAYAQDLLLEIYDYKNEKRILERMQALTVEHRSNFSASAVADINGLHDLIIGIKEVSEKFQKELQKIIITYGIKDNDSLLTRMQAANQYFAPKLEQCMQVVRNNTITLEHKPVSVMLDEFLKQVHDDLYIKWHYYKQLAQSFDINLFFDTKASLHIPNFRPQTYITNKAVSAPVDVKHPVLYQQLSLLRNELVAEKDINVYMVANKETLAEMANYLPTNKSEIILIKGFGEKKYHQYGESFLKVIQDYMTKYEVGSQMEHHPKAKKTKAAVTKEKKTVTVKENAAVSPSNSIVTATVQATIDLFKDGFTIAQIAEQRSMVSSTIEGHLALAIDRGVVTITDVLDQGVIADVMKVIAVQPNNSVTDFFNLLDKKYSYGTIRICLAQWKRMMEA
jgi:hypothetical protein